MCLIHLFQYMPQSQDFKTFLFSFLKIKNNIYFFLLCLSFLLSQTQSNSVSLVHQVSQAKQEASHWQGRYHSLASHFPIVSADCWVCFFLSPLDWDWLLTVNSELIIHQPKEDHILKLERPYLKYHFMSHNTVLPHVKWPLWACHSFSQHTLMKKKSQTLLKQKDMGKLYVHVLGVYMLPLELYGKQRLFKRVRQIFSRMLYIWSNIFLPDVKFNQKYLNVYIQTAREKLISLKDHLSDALGFQRWIRNWSLESTGQVTDLSLPICKTPGTDCWYIKIIVFSEHVGQCSCMLTEL